MINFDEIEKILDEALAKETKETLLNFMAINRAEEVLGDVENDPFGIFIDYTVHPDKPNIQPDQESSFNISTEVGNNYNYAEAA